jgi:lambda family phage portal protein
VTNTIGSGIQAQWPDPERQARWRAWMASTSIDADGRLNGYGLQALVLRSVVESGDVLIRRRPRRMDDGLTVPLQVQVLEGDYLDHGKTETTPAGGWITQGVEFDRLGRRVAYWLYPEHPGDPTGRMSATSKRYPSADFLHIYRIDRPGQVRGVPWGAGAMLRLRMLDDYQDAQLERQRLAACYTAFVGDVEAPMATDDATELLDKLEPGAIEILPPGKTISFASPPQPENDKEFMLAVLRAAAADYGIPYEVLTGDLSEVNFSSARMGWNEFSRNLDAWRWQMLSPQFLEPLASWYLDAERIAGYAAAEDDRPLWTAPARTMVDITREGPAIRDMCRAGLLSIPEAIRQQGYDPLTLAEEQAEFLSVLDRLGLQWDSDPRADTARNKEASDVTD